MAQGRKQLVDHTSLPRAQRHLAKEESQLKAEIEAFEAFLDRLTEIPSHSYQTDGGTLKDTFHSQSPSAHAPQEAVQTAYRETILAVGHWEDAYGEETTLESMADEFGVDVAVGLTGGSATWSPFMWNQLRRTSEEVIETRQRTLDVLTVERRQLRDLERSLGDIGAELAAIERGHYSFTDRSDRLRSIERQLEELAQKHQSYLQQRQTSNDTLFSAFIYAALETDYPGLAALATAREVRDRIELRHWAGMV
ncbi:DUF7260 family protein [Haladaptatus halobius]|uniref:DUF7260 family protein n=1 Tax=Haladaptatus halobius TaxID=2884875 RepID=UPI001D0BE4E4|nr:hypothetical protein [Haladaptatus halobius]